ncbi:MAG: bifunctional UDP-N-acetylglucosamine diphosphorylase/glucosamine-1-phosphate N-acetyltransferase GlmU [Acidobacteriota bacterium]
MKSIPYFLVLSAGKGTRFKSSIPKVLHPILGKPMLEVLIEKILKLQPKKVYIIVGYKKEMIIERFSDPQIKYIIQDEQLGTAHAIMCCEDEIEFKDEDGIIINGDIPLIKISSLLEFYKYHLKNKNSLTLMSAILESPNEYGRIVRGSSGEIKKIVEAKDLTEEENKIKEINAGIYCFSYNKIFPYLKKISNVNKKKEYYLTDIIDILIKKGEKVGVWMNKNSDEILGINDREELSRATDILRLEKIRELQKNGTTIIDPNTSWIEWDVSIGKDSIVYPYTFIEGNTKIGRNSKIYSFTHISNSIIGDSVTVLTSSYIQNSNLKNGSTVGPFCRIRMNSQIEKGARVGNFVEVKNTKFGEGSKAMHLTYLGDSEIGKNVNIGAGTITCNFDGKKKNKTIIESDVFIGSGTELVAPVKIGKKSYVGAGSTITKNVPPFALAIAREKQKNKLNWVKKKIMKCAE